MNLQLAVALLPYLSLGVSLIVFLALFFELSRRIRSIAGRIPTPVDNSKEIKELLARIEELEAGPNLPEPAASLRPANLNGTTRSKVLKMHRLGQPADRIADSLKVPKGEVDLLVMVHRIVMRPYEQTPADGGKVEAS